MPDHETSPWKLPYPDPTGETKLGAEDFKELATTLNTLFNEKFFVYKSYAAGATLKAGELAEQTKSGETFTMPAVGTANQTIAIFSAVAETKLTTAAKFIGDFTNASTMVLSTNQHVVLQSNGTNWLIIAGEPKREQKYEAAKSYSKAEAEAGVEPSATRLAYVVFSGTVAGLSVGGVALANNLGTPTGPILVPPGQKWKATVAAETNTLLL